MHEKVLLKGVMRQGEERRMNRTAKALRSHKLILCLEKKEYGDAHGACLDFKA